MLRENSIWDTMDIFQNVSKGSAHLGKLSLHHFAAENKHHLRDAHEIMLFFSFLLL